MRTIWIMLATCWAAAGVLLVISPALLDVGQEHAVVSICAGTICILWATLFAYLSAEK